MQRWLVAQCSAVSTTLPPLGKLLPMPLDFPSVSGALGDLGSLALGYRGLKESREDSRADRKLQRDALQKGIQWRVADANMAGIHPLFALGAQLNSPSPVSMDFGGYSQMAESLRSLGSRPGEAADRAAAARAAAQAGELAAAQIRESDSRAFLNTIEAMDVLRRVRGNGGVDSAPERALVFPPNIPFKTSPTAKAQTVQDEYGDVVEAGYGIARLAYDLLLNMGAGIRRSGRAMDSRLPRPSHPESERRYYGSDAR